MKYIIVITTFPTKKDAQRISRALISKSLAACCQIIGPIQSHYIWRNKVNASKEYLCLIKTAENRYKILEKTIKTMHPYQIPEIIAVNICKGYSPYLKWINTQFHPKYYK